MGAWTWLRASRDHRLTSVFVMATCMPLCFMWWFPVEDARETRAEILSLYLPFVCIVFTHHVGLNWRKTVRMLVGLPMLVDWDVERGSSLIQCQAIGTRKWISVCWATLFFFFFSYFRQRPDLLGIKQPWMKHHNLKYWLSFCCTWRLLKQQGNEQEFLEHSRRHLLY